MPQQPPPSGSGGVELGDENLPLKLIKSEAIPPCPRRSESCIDWLPDFSGYSWLAYASSSLLVISHLPITTSDGHGHGHGPGPAPAPEPAPAPGPGPLFRQVFELGGVVSAVCWSPVTPLLAASSDSSIRLFSFTGFSSWFLFLVSLLSFTFICFKLLFLDYSISLLSSSSCWLALAFLL